VYRITSQIPKGKVATYGQIARLTGNPQAARAVGMALKNNPTPITVPCHRVVGADGSLVGYSGQGGIATKRKLLEKEGVAFVGQKVDLSRSGWIKIDEQLEKALKLIIKRLTGKKINWFLGGSTSLALQSVDVIPHDIDILTDKKGALAIQKELTEFTQESVAYKKSDLFKSWFGAFLINDIKVEVMGDLSTRANINDDWGIPVKFESVKYLVYNSTKIPVQSLKEEYMAYLRMGRLEKANKIKSCLKGETFEGKLLPKFNENVPRN